MLDDRNRARRGFIRLGRLAEHLNVERETWLSRNVPPGMTIAEYLIEALLDDAIDAERNDGPVNG